MSVSPMALLVEVSRAKHVSGEPAWCFGATTEMPSPISIREHAIRRLPCCSDSEEPGVPGRHRHCASSRRWNLNVRRYPCARTCPTRECAAWSALVLAVLGDHPPDNNPRENEEPEGHNDCDRNW